MNILIIGSGAREHAIAWKLKQSPRVDKLFVAPGNAGTARIATNIELPSPVSSLQSLVPSLQIDLVIIGPEAPLADGMADELRAANIPVFGPNKNAAEIESSKSFAKAFMARHNIPTARYATFDSFDAAFKHLGMVEYDVVLKASGLAAGKGVILPNSYEEASDALYQIMVAHEFGAAGDEVVIEERLVGDEVSVMVFSDGTHVSVMPPAQDHKRLLDGDAGPNTGGMGAYAPVALPNGLMDEIKRTVIQPAIDGLRAEGRPFVGVLYPGLMLTADGPRVLEFNCRFGDPETEVVLPLLETDLLDIVEACVNGTLDQVDMKWKNGAAACVVLASGGYPGKYETGLPIQGLERAAGRNAAVFHAGTALQGQTVVTNGGRVMAVTGWGSTLGDALDTAYAAVRPIRFEGMQYRRDIAQRALSTT